LNLPGGLGTALKPACEDWWLVRKPLEGTVEANVARYGTGVINIDGCRIAGEKPLRENTAGSEGMFGLGSRLAVGSTAEGRWPANVTLEHSNLCHMIRESGRELANEQGTSGYADEAQATYETIVDGPCHDPECPVALLDAQAGERKSSKGTPRARHEQHRVRQGDRQDVRELWRLGRRLAVLLRRQALGERARPRVRRPPGEVGRRGHGARGWLGRRGEPARGRRAAAAGAGTFTRR
jgi:hypothetical protein